MPVARFDVAFSCLAEEMPGQKSPIRDVYLPTDGGTRNFAVEERSRTGGGLCFGK